MSPGVIQVRADICEGCACTVNPRDPCAVCPKGKWGRVDCDEQVPLGDRIADVIETRILSPVEKALPSVGSIVETVRRCGGCTQAKHALGSRSAHPDPGTVL